MEEVDAIILQSLREIGCDLDEDIKLRSLSPEEIFKCIGKLCKSIKPDAEISNHLPSQMAQRFAAASQIVDCCKSLGFHGDLGYQTILYSNPNELRRIFMWLIENIPKSEDKTDSFHATKDVSRAKSIEDDILKKLKTDMRKPWVLEFLQPPRNAPSNPVLLEKPNVAENMDEGDRIMQKLIIQFVLTSLFNFRYSGVQKKVRGRNFSPDTKPNDFDYRYT